MTDTPREIAPTTLEIDKTSEWVFDKLGLIFSDELARLLWIEVEKKKAAAVEQATAWRDIESAPYGEFHPYEDHPEAATYVLVFNGHHIGVAYCQKDAYAPDDDKQWFGEDGHFMPQPTHWMPLPQSPKSKP